MKYYLLILFSIIAVAHVSAQKSNTQIYIIGNIHDSVPNYHPQILYEIIDQIRPDIILHEVDSQGMKEYEASSDDPKGNEIKASNLYLKVNPNTLRFPFDFEGRNSYRRDRGMVPTDNLTFRLIDSLYKANALTVEEAAIYKTFNSTTDELIRIASLSPENFNNSRTDSIAQRRQNYQYKEMLKITDTRPEFAESFVVKPNMDSISFKDGFKLMSSFWDLRNQTMANNIYNIAQQHSGKKIVVLTGFLHRYYLIKELKKLNNGSFEIKEFYQK